MTPLNGTSSSAPPYGEDPSDGFDPDTASADEFAVELSGLASHSIPAARELAAKARTRYPDDRRFARWVDVLAPAVVTFVADPARTTSAEIATWLAEHGRAHVGKWVVIDHDQLLAAADSLDAVRPVLETRPSAVAMQVYEGLLDG